MVKQNTVDGPTRKKVVLEPGWISDAFELCEPELYKVVTAVIRDDDSQNNYTVPVGPYN